MLFKKTKSINEELKEDIAIMAVEKTNNNNLIYGKETEKIIESEKEAKAMKTNFEGINELNSDSETDGSNTIDIELIDAEIDKLFEYTINLLEPSKHIEGKLVSKENGTLLNNEAFDTYESIPVEPETDYILQRDNMAYFHVAYSFYNAAGTYLSGDIIKAHPQDNCVFTAPENAALLTFSYAVKNSSGTVFEWKNIMLSKGNAKVDYVPYKLIKSEYIYTVKRDIEKIKEMNTNISPTQETFSAFLKFGVIGDSLSVGYCYNKDEEHEYVWNPEYSWVQCLARKYGTTGVNIGFSGADTRDWFTDNRGYAELIKEENLCQAYVIGLGVNDGISESFPLGTTDDIDIENPNNNAVSFYGQYAKVIQSVKQVAPKAKIFLMTIPSMYSGVPNKNAAIREIAEFEGLCENCYLVDLAGEYRPYFQKEYISKYVLEGHYTPAGYANLATLNGAILSDVMNKSSSDFWDITFIPYN